MFSEVVSKYKIKGFFSFRPEESLERKCNAPTDKCGVYLIYKVIKSMEVLIYIGSSGQIKNGELKARQSGLGGMKDRLVNGYQPKFGKVHRKKAFPEQMRIEKIPELKIYWWVTYDDEIHDIPTNVESELKTIYINNFGRLPEWHK
jgi:hypothetical protein